MGLFLILSTLCNLLLLSHGSPVSTLLPPIITITDFCGAFYADVRFPAEGVEGVGRHALDVFAVNTVTGVEWGGEIKGGTRVIEGMDWWIRGEAVQWLVGWERVG